MAGDAWMWMSTLPKRHPGLGTVVVANALITYAFCLATYALLPRFVADTPPSYFPALPWVYAYAVPVAATAAWLGGAQVLAAWAHQPRWWRLVPECAGIGALAAFLIVSPDAEHPLTAPVAEAVAAATMFCVVLGAVLTSASYALSRMLRPRKHRRRRSGSSTLPDAPSVTATPD